MESETPAIGSIWKRKGDEQHVVVTGITTGSSTGRRYVAIQDTVNASWVAEEILGRFLRLFERCETTKRTHGPCTCPEDDVPGHEPDCPSLYPAQQEPDALTRLARFLRSRVGQVLRDDETEQAISLISEARVEQQKARRDAFANSAQLARGVAQRAAGYPERQKSALDIQALILEAMGDEP